MHRRRPCQRWVWIALMLFLQLLHVAVAKRRITGRVFYNERGTEKTSSGLSVRCSDDDRLNPDDFMTAGSTDSNGIFDLSYRKKSGNVCAWDCGSKTERRPDIYCKINGPPIMPWRTREWTNWPQKNDLYIGDLQVYPDRRPTCRSSNGCGPKHYGYLVPDQEFGGICDNHDCCYATCGETRKACDDEFYALMRSKCRDQHILSPHTCYARAWTMYEAVRTFGAGAWNNAQSHCRVQGRAEEGEAQPGGSPWSDEQVTLQEQVFPEEEGFTGHEEETEAWWSGLAIGLTSTLLAIALLKGVWIIRTRRSQ